MRVPFMHRFSALMLVKQFCSPDVLRSLQLCFQSIEDKSQDFRAVPEKRIGPATLVAGYRAGSHNQLRNIGTYVRIYYVLPNGSRAVFLEVQDCEKVNLAGLIALTCSFPLIDCHNTNLKIAAETVQTLLETKRSIKTLVNHTNTTWMNRYYPETSR